MQAKLQKTPAGRQKVQTAFTALTRRGRGVDMHRQPGFVCACLSEIGSRFETGFPAGVPGDVGFRFCTRKPFRLKDVHG